MTLTFFVDEESMMLANPVITEQRNSGGFRGGGWLPPSIDWMHFKRSKSFARKCTIFA